MSKQPKKQETQKQKKDLLTENFSNSLKPARIDMKRPDVKAPKQNNKNDK